MTRRISHEHYSALFRFVYLGLMTNLLLVVSCLPLVVLLVTTDPARSWPLIAAAAPLCAPGVAAACAVFGHHSGGGVDVGRAFVAGWRASWSPAMRLTALVTTVIAVVLVDISVLAGSDAGVVLIPALAVLGVLAAAVGIVGLVAVAEVPQARLRDVLKVSAVLAVRRWLLTVVSLVVLATQAVLFTLHPAIALGLTAAPALYIAWTNSRYTLQPAL